MTENTAAPDTPKTTPESAAEPQTTPLSDNDTPQPSDAATAKLRRENQSLRQRLRESEQTAEESAGATAALETMLRRIRESELKRAVADRLADPADFVDRADFGELFPEGELDYERLNTAVDELLTEHPHYAKQPERPAPPPSNRPIENLRPGASPAPEPTSTNWHDALRSTMR